MDLKSHFTIDQVWMEELQAFADEFFSDSWNSEQLKSYFQQNSSEFCFISNEQELLAYCLSQYGPLDGFVHIFQICVLPELRGKGLGKKALLELLRHLKNVQQVFLEVDTHNEGAISFYQSLGFEKINEIRSFYRDGRDAYAMQCRGEKLAKLLSF